MEEEHNNAVSVPPQEPQVGDMKGVDDLPHGAPEYFQSDPNMLVESSSSREIADEESAIPGTSGLYTHCHEFASPLYAASPFAGILSSPVPSTSQLPSSPLLESTYSQAYVHLGGSTDLSFAQDKEQLSGVCSLGGNGSSSGIHVPSPMYGDAPVLSCSALGLPHLDSKSDLSESASDTMAICRICHQPGDEYDILISPCRCAGTLEFIHRTCLMKWLEITSKKSRKPPKCELCHYQYTRHKKFKFKLAHCRLPKVSRQDKALHVIFIINLLIIIGCAIANVMCFLSDKGQITKFPRNNATLTTEEMITLSCGVLFFVSFFIAMSVQIKARRTLYQLLVKFIMQNMEWEIDQYDKTKDSLYANKQDKQDLTKSYV